MASATVIKVQRWAKVAKATLEADGHQKDFMFWVSSPFNDAIADGAVLDIKSEKRPKKDKPDESEAWLTEVNGVSEKPVARAGGGGGRPAYQPKSREEIHASSIAGIAKSCLESVSIKSEEKLNTFAAFCAQYWVEIDKVKA